MLLMVLTGEDALLDAYEFRALLALDEADEDRRKLVRRPWGAKRAVMEWNREDCMVMVFREGGEDGWRISLAWVGTPESRAQVDSVVEMRRWVFRRV
jgi:hypothetical protein